MLHTSTTASPAGLIPPEAQKIQSRFGEITVDAGKALMFPRGMLGMPDKTQFAVVNFPNEKMRQFMLLQSLDDTNLSFITLPVNVENAIIGVNDIRQTAKDLQIPEKDLVILLIVSVHRSPTDVKLSVNARAPLFIDASRKLGAQFVFGSDQYKVQHML